MKRRLSVAKFGGSLLDAEGNGIPRIIQRLRELKDRDTIGPIAVFSAPTGFTDELISIGESYAQSAPTSVQLFETYTHMARRYVKEEYLTQALSTLAKYKMVTLETLNSINKRFNGNAKAKVLTHGGELATSSLMDFIVKSNGIDSFHINLTEWPVVTDDNFEQATPMLELSKEKLDVLVGPLDAGKTVLMGGFLGVTSDGLETVLGRGGSDLTAVFIACLLRSHYQTETLLFKDVPVQSADPKVVKNQATKHVAALTYNEAHKASMMGMKILQSPAIALARYFSQPLRVVPIDETEKSTIIKSKTSGNEIVKCIAGKTGCAIISMNDERSRSLEDSLRIWEKRNDFIDLGAETLETGEHIRDFLFLDSDFLKRNERKLKGFDKKMQIEYGLGVVTLIGDRMKNSAGVASTAISAIQGINIKRGIFAPHTSQIIIVVEEKNVNATVAAIHPRIAELDRIQN